MVIAGDIYGPINVRERQGSHEATPIKHEERLRKPAKYAVGGENICSHIAPVKRRECAALEEKSMVRARMKGACIASVH